MKENIKFRMIRNRAKALYHNCHATACFKYSDADATEDKNERDKLINEALAYEVMAGWIKGLIDII